MPPGLAIAVWAALRCSVHKTTELFTPGLSAEQRGQLQQQAAAMRNLKARAQLKRIQREAQLAEDRRKELLLAPEVTESLYQQAWFIGRGEKSRRPQS